MGWINQASVPQLYSFYGCSAWWGLFIPRAAWNALSNVFGESLISYVIDILPIKHVHIVYMSKTLNQRFIASWLQYMYYFVSIMIIDGASSWVFCDKM